jgi:F-box/leucine-rich repeat protein 14
MVGWQDQLPESVFFTVLGMIYSSGCSSGQTASRAFRLVSRHWRNSHDAVLPRLDLSWPRALCDASMQSDACMQLFGRMTSVESLSLKKAVVASGIGSSLISAFTNIKRLHLVNCISVNTQALRVVSRLTKLKKLSLIKCSGVEDEGLQQVSTLTKLNSLDITCCARVTDAGIAALSSLTALRRLNVLGCQLVGSKGLLALSCITSMIEINLGKCFNVVEVGPLAQVTALTCLNLSGCNVTDTSMGRLCDADPGVRCTLTRLNLKSTRLSEFGFLHVAKLTALRTLDLSSTQLTEQVLVSFQALSSLTRLELAEGTLERLHSIVAQDTCRAYVALGSLRSLRHLNLKANVVMNDFGIRVMSWGLTNLTTLHLGGCKNTSDAELEAIGSMKALTSLNLSYLGITDAGLRHLSSLTALTHINLCFCPQVTNMGLQTLHTLPALDKIITRGCGKLSN